MKRYPHISALLFDQPWAITERALASMIRRIEAAERLDGVDLEALSTKLGRPLDNTGNRVEMRGSVAVVDVTGPIFRYANLMTDLSGATSVEMLARDFQSAADNPLVTQILLNVDSPGGEIGGIGDLADLIRATSESRKPVTAFIDDVGASAGYWLASAAGKVYASQTSLVGSVGVVASITDRTGAQERQGVKTYTFVSSQSPRKRNDPASEDGRESIQGMVDSLGAIFVDTVARFRGVTPDHVMSNFGKGFVLGARPAQGAGMIDGVTNFETLVQSLQNNQQPRTAAIAAKETRMPDVNEQPAALPAAPSASVPAPAIPQPAIGFATDLAASERTRIQTILNLPEAQGRADLARTLAFEPGMSPESAQRILASAPVAAPPAAPALTPLERAMANIKNPAVGTGTDPQDSASAEAARILSFLPAHQRVKVAN